MPGLHINRAGPAQLRKEYQADRLTMKGSRIVENILTPETLFVVYCAGPHCNATEKAAIRLAKLGRPDKKMIGAIAGWLDEGFSLIK